MALSLTALEPPPNVVRVAAFWVCGVLAASMAVAAPPALPPLPGESAPPDGDTPKPTPKTPSPAKPKTPSDPAPERPAQPRDPEPERSSQTHDPEPAAPASPPSGGLGPIPDVEPPQPESSGPAVETEDPRENGSSGPRRGARQGAGAVPQLGPSEIPGEADEDERGARLRIPPPPRPPYTGVGLFIGASVTFAVALTEQIVAHVLVKRRCIDPISAETFEDIDDAEVLGEVVARCVPGVVPAIALRVHSDIGLLATIGLAAGGAILRGRRLAHDDVFGSGPDRDFRGLRWGGVGLLGLGVVTWFTTGAASWGMLAGCKSGTCATRARAMNFSMRSTSAVLIASGAGMLGFAEAYRRNRDRFIRDRALSLSPTFGPGYFGLGMSGQF